MLIISCAYPQHHWCLPTTRYVRGIDTIIENGKKKQKEYELKTEKR